jgi:hypothetical protein
LAIGEAVDHVIWPAVHGDGIQVPAEGDAGQGQDRRHADAAGTGDVGLEVVAD